MNRQIKFRVWDTNKSRYWDSDMREVSLRFDGTPLFWTGDECYIAGKFWPVEWILEQFTGLLDKNGKEIYENDIIRFITKVELGDAEINIGQVIYDIKFMCFLLDKHGQSLFDGVVVGRSIEVIGNIHENPRLLQ